MTTATAHLAWIYSAPTLAERAARQVPEHHHTIARWIARHNTGTVDHARAVAVIADTLAEAEGMDEATATETAARYLANNPQI